MPDAPDIGNVRAFTADLRVRVLAVSLLPLILAIFLLATYFAQREIHAMEDALRERGQDVTARLAEMVAHDLHANQPQFLKRLLDYERDIHGAAVIGIRDAAGRWWLVSGQAKLLADPNHLSGGDWLSYTRPVYLPTEGEPPNKVLSIRIGEIVTLFNKSRIQNAQSEIILTSFTLVSVLVLISALFAWRLSGRLSRPLRAIIHAVQALAAGDLQARVREESDGELRALEHGVNQMAERLQAHTRDLEERIHAATASLREQKKASDAATSAKSRFLAAASHDLRQPLHTLMLLVGALRERIPEDDAETLRLARHIETSTQSMGTLLNTLLDLSRLDAGIVVARPTCIRAAEVLDSIRQQFTPLAEDKGLRLHVQTTRMTVFSDPALLERVIANLTANAIRYTSEGGIIVGVRRVQRDWARFEVWDSGTGIAPEYKDKIFDEFFQLDNQGPRDSKGLGLGLSIVKRLVGLLGSEIDVRSKPGRGSRFSIRAMRCELPEGLGLDGEEESAPSARRPLVAFIDDDPSILEAMLALFEQWEIEVATGADPTSVIEDCRQLGQQPDAIISDYRLAEGRTGIEAIAELRAEFGPDTPALLITGDTAPSTIQALDASGLQVLHKPLKPARLRAMLKHLLKRA